MMNKNEIKQFDVEGDYIAQVIDHEYYLLFDNMKDI